MELIDKMSFTISWIALAAVAQTKTAGLTAGIALSRKQSVYWRLHLLLNPITVKITVDTKQLKGGEFDEFRQCYRGSWDAAKRNH